MIFFLRSLPVLSAAWIVLWFRLALRSTTSFWYFAAIGVIGVLIALWLLIRRAALPQGRWSLLVFPTLTLVAIVGVLLFSEHVTLQWVLLVGVGVFFALYAEQIFRFAYAPARYQSNALVNLGLVFAVLSTFFSSLTIFDLQLFANAPLWMAIAIFAAIAAFWCVMVLRFVDVPALFRWPWGLTIGIAMVESFALLAWLPALPIVKAAVFALVVTGLLQRVRADITGSKTLSRWATVVLAIMLLFVLVTARWFA